MGMPRFPALLLAVALFVPAFGGDLRDGPLKDLNGYFPFTPPTDSATWTSERAAIRNRLQVALGLLPMPTRTPLNAVIHGKIDGGEYTIEKVYFESAPGFFVTGNLYRPKQITGKAPVVLFAHGHWKDARFLVQDADYVRKEIATGQETFTEGGKSRFQSLCVQLARMGCIVWQWDTLSDSDSLQFSPEVIHRFAKQRPEMNDTQSWGLYSAPAEAHLQSVMGLQTWNALRSVDFVLSLPDVDPTRVAATGASGGGTQTMMLAALDERIALSFPAVMVSTAMQGGCSCENASLLRIGQGNVHFAALFAPKPQGMTTANDWTKEMSTKGFPQLRQLYTTLGHPEAVMLHRDEASPHNYNQAARTAFYGWLNTHFRLGQPMPIQERDYKVLTKAELSVWDKSHPAPLAVSPDFERRLLRWFADDSAAQFQQATPVARTALLRNYVEAVLGTAVRPNDVQASTETPQTLSAHMETRGTLTHATRGESVHFTTLQPAKPNGRTVLWLRDDGQAALRTADGKVRTHFLALLEHGFTVLAPDLYLQGGTKVSHTRRVKETRAVPAYTFGYNDALVAQRAHDVELLTIYARQTFRGQLAVVSAGDASISAVLAGYHEAPDAAYFATAGFRFAQLKDVHDLQFLPGGAKYGDLPGLIDGLPMAASAVRWTDVPKATDEDALAWLKTAFTPRR
jgi:dienelactone hydrolase